ncbi:RNA pyrophosphohydrolase [Bosea sp. AS-1]|uniref:RNA pyrophosphohydrolase n=1 Tax=Bosea sp. AS-1 TaxID=2015316 RepID=UPI0020C074FF|nr:RNA pyrophosphohydrolase [Bosea sp. AS-1]
MPAPELPDAASKSSLPFEAMRAEESLMRDQLNRPIELTFGDLIGDPIVHMMMKADGIDESDLLQAICAAAPMERPIKGSGTAIPKAKVKGRRQLRRGVGIMLVNRVGQVWVGQRIDTTAEAWQMPQGGIDHAETPLMAAQRELREELGTDNADIIAQSRTWHSYEIPSEILDRALSPRCRGQIQKWILMRFRGQDDEINISTEHPEFSAWKWVPVESLVELVVPFKREVYRAVTKEFEPYLREASRIR